VDVFPELLHFELEFTKYNISNIDPSALMNSNEINNAMDSLTKDEKETLYSSLHGAGMLDLILLLLLDEMQ